jgi:hypothetical protein
VQQLLVEEVLGGEVLGELVLVGGEVCGWWRGNGRRV